MSLPVVPFSIEIHFLFKTDGASPELEAEIKRRLALTQEVLEAVALDEVSRRMAGLAAMKLSDTPPAPPQRK